MGLFRFLGRGRAVTYKLVKNKKCVDIGVTSTPYMRNKQHRASGKKYDYMKITSRPLLRRTALKRETRNISSFRRATGQLPKYNKTWNGKFNKRYS